MKVLVLTLSDRASQGIYEDRSGPAIEKIMAEKLHGVKISRSVISDDSDAIQTALLSGLCNDIIITTGGTGIGPRDNTPDVTASICDRLVPGIAEYLRSESCKQTVNAVISRGVAGIKDSTIIINVPGSVRGAVFCTELLIPILPHAQKMLCGEGH